MNFIEAIRLAKDGTRMKRKDWVIEIFILKNNFWIYKNTFKYILEVDDVLADDWEVVE